MFFFLALGLARIDIVASSALVVIIGVHRNITINKMADQATATEHGGSLQREVSVDEPHPLPAHHPGISPFSPILIYIYVHPCARIRAFIYWCVGVRAKNLDRQTSMNMLRNRLNALDSKMQTIVVKDPCIPLPRALRS